MNGTLESRWKTAWITGGGSGIGRELALALAGNGVAVAVSGRRKAPLEDLARTNSRIHPFPLDVTDPDACRGVHNRISATLGEPDLVIMSAGIWLLMDVTDYSADDLRRIMSANYLGAVNVAATCLPRMRQRGQGQLCFMGSVAAYRGIPRTGAYAPAKAALIAHAEALRTDAAQFGIGVSVVNCGFVNTPMSAGNNFDMPFIVEPDYAAARILGGLRRNRFEISFPWTLTLVMKLMRVLPYAAYFPLIDRFVQRGPFGLGTPAKR